MFRLDGGDNNEDGDKNDDDGDDDTATTGDGGPVEQNFQFNKTVRFVRYDDILLGAAE